MNIGGKYYYIEAKSNGELVFDGQMRLSHWGSEKEALRKLNKTVKCDEISKMVFLRDELGDEI